MRSSKIKDFRMPHITQMSATSHHEINPKQQKSKLILSNLKVKFLINTLITKLRFLVPPFRPPLNLQQNWQQDLDIQNKDNQQEYSKQTLAQQLTNRYQAIKYLNIIQGILSIIFSWSVSVSLVYEIKILSQISIANIFFIILNFILKIQITYEDSDKQCTYEIHYFQDFLQPLIFLSANIFMTIRYHTDLGYLELPILLFCMGCVFIQWQNLGRYFNILTLYAEQYKKRKQLRIIQLFIFAFIMVHIFSLIMYAMTTICPEGKKSWLQKSQLDLDHQKWYIKYIYAYYWANTTMVTVGYGDITPQNFVQAIIVTMIQIIGAAIFGYMINVIGLTVNEIQKKTLSLEEQQATLTKLKWHYELSRELCYKMKMQIIKQDTKTKDEALKNDQQSQFLNGVDEGLKQQFVLETNMKVIKKCIFFLTYFTINFQNQIALKLIRCIYKKDEIIHQQIDCQKQLVIINYGKVNLYVKKMRLNQQINKLIKTIQLNQGKTLTSNVYGYSSLIMNKNTNLKAISQTSSTCYILKRQDLLQSLSKSILDFESFSEMKQKMLQFENIDFIEAPILCDYQKHYIPNIQFMIKKIKHFSQNRAKTSRMNRKMKRILITIDHYQNKTILYIPSARQVKQPLDQQIFNIQQYDNKDITNKIYQEIKQNKIYIDQARSFQKFFKTYNINQISVDYEKSMSKKQYNQKFQKKKSSAIRQFKKRPSII